MKIAHVIDSADYAGTERIVESLVRLQAAQNHEVFICAPEPAQLRERFADLPNVQFLKTLPGARGWRFRLGRELKGQKIDILHGVLARGISASIVVRAIFRIPVVCHVQVIGTGPVLKKFSYFGKLIAISDYVRTFLIEEIGARPSQIVTIRNAVEIPTNLPVESARRNLRNLLEIQHDSQILLFASRLTWDKGLELVLDALDSLDENIHVCVCAAPNGSDIEERLRKKAADSNPRIYYLGERKDVVDLMIGADAVLMPSLIEPFGIVPVEALVRGIPVLTSHAGGLKEIAEISAGGTHELLTENPNAFLKSLRAGLDRLDELKQSASESRERLSAYYNSEKMNKDVEDLYVSLVQTRRLSIRRSKGGLASKSPYDRKRASTMTRDEIH